MAIDIKHIRELFHDINNKLNVIVSKAGFNVLSDEPDEQKSESSEELKNKSAQYIEDFKTLEQAAIDTAKLGKELKKIIYEALNIDTSKPR